MVFRKTIVIANVILFSALAIMLTSIKAEVPYPLLPYLKFDFAEIPVMIVLLIVGPIPSLITEVIHWISLTITHGWVLGPLMKFISVVPMIIGFWLGVTAYKRVSGGARYNSTICFILGNILGIIARVVVASIANIIVLMGGMYGTPPTIAALMTILLLTGIFNMLHVPISSVVSAVIVKGAVARIPGIGEKAWLLIKPSKT
jgi:riboflavin transporter FmnP